MSVSDMSHLGGSLKSTVMNHRVLFLWALPRFGSVCNKDERSPLLTYPCVDNSMSEK